MPTYEYECTSCGQHIEAFQRFSEDPLTTCGNCGGALRKVFHPAGIVFKGSGFYATDSRKKEPSSTAGKKESSGGKPEAATKPSGGKSGGGSGDKGGSSAPAASKEGS